MPMSKTYKNRSDLIVVFCFDWLFFLHLDAVSYNNNEYLAFLCFPEHFAIFQEKIKEKESRKTQTFKKDEDKKKKLMQSEVQVSYYLLLVWDSYHTKQLFILSLEAALQSALVKASVGSSKKRTSPFSPTTVT